MAMLNLHFDDIVYQLQATGGISVYWQEITSKISSLPEIKVIRTKGHKLNRYFPVNSSADIFHSSYFRTTPNSNVKNVVTVFDFVYELGFLKTSGSILNTLQRKVAIESADAIICISENTKKDLLARYPNLPKNPKIFTIYLGSSFDLNQPNDLGHPNGFTIQNLYRRLTDLENMDITKNYVLFVGGRISYKNFSYSLLAFAKSPLPGLGYKMLCTGAKFSRSEEELINRLGLSSYVLAIDNATSNELKYLYQNAFTLMYPSLYEGFGLPPLEAMSCGCPVIASNTSSLPEVVGDAGLLIDPYNVDSTVEALKKLLDSKVRHDCIKKGIDRAKLFSWEEAAQKHLEVYKYLLK